MRNISKKTIWATSMIAVFIAIVVLVVTRTSEAVELPFIEGGALYESNALNPGDQGRILAAEATRVFGYDRASGKILYRGTGTNLTGEVWLFDKAAGTKAMISDQAIDAQISPDSSVVAISNSSHEIWLLTTDGTPIKRIGIHGATPIFSYDGQYLAYEKLADFSFDGDEQSFYEFSPGMAVYNLRTNEEIVVTHSEHGEDFGAAAFSPDLKKLYFHSGRGGNVSLWSVNLDGTKLEQLTNVAGKQSNVPMLNYSALWTSDRKIAISYMPGYDAKEVWLFRFDVDGSLVESRILTNGESPQWLARDKTIAVRIIHNGKKEWQAVNVQ